MSHYEIALANGGWPKKLFIKYVKPNGLRKIIGHLSPRIREDEMYVAAYSQRYSIDRGSNLEDKIVVVRHENIDLMVHNAKIFLLNCGAVSEDIFDLEINIKLKESNMGYEIEIIKEPE